jgi:hypothetical protein
MHSLDRDATRVKTKSNADGRMWKIILHRATRVTRVVNRPFVVARRVSVVSGPDAGAAKPYNPQGSWVHRSASTTTTRRRRREDDAREKYESWCARTLTLLRDRGARAGGVGDGGVHDATRRGLSGDVTEGQAFEGVFSGGGFFIYRLSSAKVR